MGGREIASGVVFIDDFATGSDMHAALIMSLTGCLAMIRMISGMGAPGNRERAHPRG
jgi:hypothetical protein